jgi:hypothetical protein
MTKRFTAGVVIALVLTCSVKTSAQNIPVLNLGFSGSGVGAISSR